MSQPAEHDREGVAWQRGLWDRYPEIYQREVDPRFVPVVEQVIRRATLAPGQHVLDLRAGTGAAARIKAGVETETLGFDFTDFTSAWTVLAGVTTAQLPPERQQEAQAAVRAAMWLHGESPRRVRNVTQFIVGQRRA